MTETNEILNLEKALAALEESSRTFLDLDDPRSILRAIATQVRQVAELEECSVILFDDEKTGTVVASSENPDMLDTKIQLAKYPELIRVIETNQPLLITDVVTSPLLKEVKAALNKKNIRSIAVLPVTVGDEMLGAMFLRLTRVGDPISNIPLSYFQATANTAALALRNIRLRRDVAGFKQETHYAKEEAKEEHKYRKWYQELFNLASDGLLIVDRKGRLVEANRKFELLTGYSIDETKRMSYLDVIFADDRKKMIEFFKDYRKNPGSRMEQFRLISKSGDVKEIIMSVDLLPGAEGQALVSMQDITRQKLLQNQLQRTNEFFKNIISSSVDAIVAADMKGKIIILNESAQKISGYKPEEIANMNIRDFYTPGAAKDAMKRLRSAEYGGVGKLEATHYNIVGKNGEEIPISLSAAIIYDGAEEIASMGIFHDLRPRIRIEQELRAAQIKLIDSEKHAALSALSGATSHELNQPLTSIMGYAELLQKKLKVDDEIVNKAVQTIVSEAERMGETIKKISKISRFRTRDYIGAARILDIEDASRPQSRYENLFLGMRDGLMEFRLNESGTPIECVFTNPAAVKILGRTGVGDLLERGPDELFNTPGIGEKIIREARKEGGGTLFVVKIVRPDGLKISVEITANFAETDEAPPAIEILFRDVTDRINVQERLEEAEHRARTLLEMAGKLGLGIIMMTAEKRDEEKIIYANDRTEEILGLSVAEMRTFPFANLLPSEDRDKFANLFDLSSGELEGVLDVQTKIVKRDGSSVPIELHAITTQFIGKRVVISFIRDVTEQVNIREELLNLKEFSENVLNNAPIGIITIDRKGNVLSVNDKEVEIMGIPSKDYIVGLNLLSLKTTLGNNLRQIIKRGLQGEKVSISRVPYTSVVGKSMIIRIEGVPLLDENGKVRGGVILVEDVTEQAELEESLRRERSFHESVIEEAPSPVVGLALDATIVLFNRAIEINSGYSRDEVLGKNILDVFPMEQIKRKDVPKIFDRLEKNQSVRDFFTATRDKQGELHEMLWNMAAVRNESGELTGAIAVGRDVTTEKKLERETAKRRTLLDVMRQIMRASLEGSDLKKLCLVLKKEVEKLIKHDGFSMMLINGDGVDYIVFHDTWEMTLPKQGSFKLDNTITGEIIRSGKPRLVKDFKKLPHLLSDDSIVVKSGIRSGLNVPIKRHNRLIGTLNVGSLTPNMYTEDDLDIFSQIADEFAIAFENHALMRQLRETNENLASKTTYLETLLNAARSFRIDMTASDAARQYAENIEHIFQSSRVIIYLKTPDKDFLAPSYSKQPSNKIKKHDVPIKGAVKKYFESRDDYIYHKDIKNVKTYEPFMRDAKAALIVPIRIGDDQLGLLISESEHKNPYKTEDIDLIVLVTKIMAASIYNIRLFDQTCFLEKTQEDIVENAGALIATVNTEGLITRFNRALEQFTGYTKREMIGQPVWNVIKQRKRREWMKRAWKIIEKGDDIRDQVINLQKKDGAILKAVFTSTAACDSKGKIVQFIFVGYSFTDREALERQLEQSVKMASLGQMAASIAHDLNNPLTAITSYAQLLLKKLQNEGKEKKNLDYLKQVINGANRIDDLVGKIMDYSRLDSGEKKKLDVNVIIEETLSFSEMDITKGDVKLVKKLDKSIPFAMGYENQLQQVFINILTNASYILQKQGGGQIVIKTSHDDKNIQVEISDDGPGMTKEQLERIFDPFYTTKPQGEGTGLGLSIVKNIVEKHSGDVKVKSKPGKGSAFTVILPAYPRRNPKVAKKKK